MSKRAVTANQQHALEVQRRAREAGMSLSGYARSQGLAERPIYDALAALRRRSAVAAARQCPTASDFIAVRLAADSAAAPVCSIVVGGMRIDCAQWPPVAWLATLANPDAAA